MSIERKIITKSFQLTLVLTIANAIVSYILSLTIFGSIGVSAITGILGNVTILESAILFLYGIIGAYSNAPKLRFDKKDENNPVFVRLKTGDRLVQTKRHMNVVDDGNPSKQARPFIAILCGGILLAEVIILALLKF